MLSLWLKRCWLLVLPVLGVSCSGSSARPPVFQQVLQGAVTDAAGIPLAGAFVTAQAPRQAITVLTDDAGRYALSGLDAATYQVQAKQRGFTPSAAAPYTHQFGQTGTMDFVLQQAEDRYSQAPSSQFLALLPDGETKRRFILDCTGCHQFDQRTVGFEGRLKSKDQWRQRIEQMLSFAGGSSGFPVMSPSRNAEETADWLIAHLGDEDDPLPTFAPLPAPTGAAAQVRITEYPIPNPQDLPHDLLPDPAGNILITGMMTHQMYTLDPDDGTFSTTPIPTSVANPRALAISETGDWWVLLGFPRKIARYTPATDTWRDFDIGMYPHSIVLGEGGKVWFNGHFTKNPEQIGYLDAHTGQVKTYDVPVDPMPDGGSTIPYGLRQGPDGTLWATQLVGGRLIRFDPAAETFTLYALPTPYSGPRRPAVGPDGTVWIPEYANNRLARFDPASETFTEYELPVPNALPYIVRVHPTTGWIWIATAAADAVLRFDPQTEHFVVHPLPTQSALVRHMEIDERTGAVWVAYGNSPAVSPKLARIEVL